jgi:hypothetical protein
MIVADAHLPSSILATMLNHGEGALHHEHQRMVQFLNPLFVLVFLNVCIYVYAFNNLRCNFCMSLLLNNMASRSTT